MGEEPQTSSAQETPERAPLGPPAEAEVPHHAPDPSDEDRAGPVEESLAFELAAEDGRPLPPDVVPETSDDDGPAFRPPPAP